MKIAFKINVNILVVFISLVSFNANSKWIKHSFEVMGTVANIEFEAPEQKDATEILDSVVAEMHRIDELMSPFKHYSELSKINRLAASKPLIISEEMFNLLVKSEEFSHLTEGAFDISFSSLGKLYDYRKSLKPNKIEIDALKQSINYQSIKLNSVDLSISFTDQAIKIDLGGIAKGYAVDQCINILKSLGVINAYVSAGGDSRIIGKKDNRLWYIGIKHPRNKDKLLVNLPLEEVSISTSGDYERFFIQDGVRYHHIIDPKTGDSARELQSVTILAANSTMADALSTSVFILGRLEGLKLINNIADTSAIIVDSKGKLYFSNDISKLE